MIIRIMMIMMIMLIMMIMMMMVAENDSDEFIWRLVSALVAVT